MLGLSNRQRITARALINVTLFLLLPVIIGNRYSELVGYIVPELKFIGGN